jgi:hypothetical protein
VHSQVCLPEINYQNAIPMTTTEIFENIPIQTERNSKKIVFKVKRKQIIKNLF